MAELTFTAMVFAVFAGNLLSELVVSFITEYLYNEEDE